MMKYSISFPDALRKIYLEVKGERRIYNRPELEKISQSIKYADQWLQFELDYWEEYHINKKQYDIPYEPEALILVDHENKQSY